LVSRLNIRSVFSGAAWSLPLWRGQAETFLLVP
jgi:hypothetical protein